MTYDSVAFENFVTEVLIKSEKYSDVQPNKVFKNREIDIIAKPKEPNGQTLVIEVKLFTSKINTGLIEHIHAKWADISSEIGNSYPVIVSLGSLTDEAVKVANAKGVGFWNFDDLEKQLDDVNEFNKLFSKYRTNIKAFSKISMEKRVEQKGPSKEDLFINNLKSIPPGKQAWSKYQQTIYDIFEHVFCPPLDAPKYELADDDKRNRRDIIFENPSQNGFWKSIKEDYKGDYIVVDAKNYAPTLSKRPIIDIAHYLKPYGCGMFGIIVSRKGIGPSGIHARKEQWIGNQKMIVVLSDDDVVDMLKEKAKNHPPEEILRKKLSDFRMKL